MYMDDTYRKTPLTLVRKREKNLLYIYGLYNSNYMALITSNWPSKTILYTVWRRLNKTPSYWKFYSLKLNWRKKSIKDGIYLSTKSPISKIISLIKLLLNWQFSTSYNASTILSLVFNLGNSLGRIIKLGSQEIRVLLVWRFLKPSLFPTFRCKKPICLLKTIKCSLCSPKNKTSNPKINQ